MTILGTRVVVFVVALSLLVSPLRSPIVRASEPSVDLIIQAKSATDLSRLSIDVVQQGGKVTGSLHVINALAVQMPTDSVRRLEQSSSFARAWPDYSVRSAESADPGEVYLPWAVTSYEPDDFALENTLACDGNRDEVGAAVFDVFAANSMDPDAYQVYQFTPEIDAANVPNRVGLRLVVAEEKLSAARIQVWQNSTQAWHSFDIGLEKKGSETRDKNIDVTLDLTPLLRTPEDLAAVQVRFVASNESSGEKAEVDCVNLNLQSYPAGTPDMLYLPNTGNEYRSETIETKKVYSLDGERAEYKEIPVSAVNDGVYQLFRFSTKVDPADLPQIRDLRLVLMQKNLGKAYVEVYQASTRIWHRFDIDTQNSNENNLDMLFDLSDVLKAPEDFKQIDVRLYAYAIDGGGKAKVDLISLRLASLMGEIVSLDASSSFEALNAAPVWNAGNTGYGVHMAVLDTGVQKYRELMEDTHGEETGYLEGWNVFTNESDGEKDTNGHGTIVSSVASNQKHNDRKKFYGVAPDFSVIPIKVLDEQGMGSYSQVIAGIQWAINHKDKYNIRILNMSLSAPVRSHYWDDPLNQAAMRAWQAGMVVVVAAGNSGPAPMSIGVPGNNPYVITVGAFTDAYTPTDWSDDYIPDFSAAGPTFEGFVKPDISAL